MENFVSDYLVLCYLCYLFVLLLYVTHGIVQTLEEEKTFLSKKAF